LQDAQNAGRKGHVSLIARVAVAVAAILWVLWGQDWRELAGVLQNLDPWYFALSLVLYTSVQALLGVRWWLLLRAQSIHIPVLAAVRLFFLGLFYNNVMPGAVGGDVLKAWYVTKHTNKRLEGVLSVFVDRCVGLVGLVLMAAFTYFVFVRGEIVPKTETEQVEAPGWLTQHRAALVWASLAVAAVLLAVLVLPAGRARLSGAIQTVRRRGLSLLYRTKDAFVVYCSKPGTLLGTMLLTFVAQSLTIVAIWLIGRDLTVEARLSHYFFIFPVVWVVGAVPVSVAGLGVVEASTVGLFVSLAGTTREKALALALCQRLIWVLASLPGGVIHLLGTHLPREEISVDGRETAN
jgi:hypothetical protein